MSCSVDTSYPSARARPWRGAAMWSALTVLAAVPFIPSSRALAQDTLPNQVIHFKGVTLTPGGYFAAEGLYRTHSTEADIGTSYNAIPFTGTSPYFLSEWRGSARQSRLSLLAAGTPNSSVKLSGYWESDFLSAGVTSNSTESNSYTMRLRQFWGQMNFTSGFGFVAGQAWSTITTEKKGVAPLQEFIPQTIDAQYVTGFNWARQWQLRLWTDLGSNNHAWLVGAVEETQTTVGGHGAPANVVLGQVGGSLLNSTANYSTDLAPDVVAKFVFEPGFGHWEIKAIGSVFRSRVVFADTALQTSYNSHVFGGGVGIGTVFPFYETRADGTKRDVVDFGVSGLYGRGIGRYGTGQLADVVVRPNGQLAPILQGQGLASLEIHATPRLDIYLYGGAEYNDRNAFVTGVKGSGYGSPLLSNAGCQTELPPVAGPYVPLSGTCNADTRALWMGVGGFWYRFYQGPYGRFQFGMQYSYLQKETWSGLPAASNPLGPGIQPTAIDPMGFFSFRYYLP
jgi:hypothetical protein